MPFDQINTCWRITMLRQDGSKGSTYFFTNEHAFDRVLWVVSRSSSSHVVEGWAA